MTGRVTEGEGVLTPRLGREIFRRRPAVTTLPKRATHDDNLHITFTPYPGKL